MTPRVMGSPGAPERSTQVRPGQSWRSLRVVSDPGDSPPSDSGDHEARRSTADPRDLAGVLHDVSNALTVMLGWIEQARSEGARPEAIAYALTIVEQRARIARDLARQGIGGPRVDEQRALAEVVGEVVASLEVEASQRSVKVVFDGERALARVAGALDLAQVITNLIMNACAHAPPHSTITVHASQDDTSCTISVTDEGPGVAPERRESIFQGDSRRPGGTGIGLRHSRKIARGRGGDVELVGGSGGKGAHMRVTWPRVDAVPRPPTPSSRVTELDGVRVLVVEDDLAVTQLLDTVLDARGAKVTIATSQVELNAALAKGPYDAALIDLSPIAHDPAGEIAALRVSSPDVSVVLISGSADALPPAVSSDAIELVRKPFEVREVVAALLRKVRQRTP